jgi:hypothetical protein
VLRQLELAPERINVLIDGAGQGDVGVASKVARNVIRNIALNLVVTTLSDAIWVV